MPQLTENEYNDILNIFGLESNSFEVLIETGTNYGQTLQNLKYRFKDIHSIELSTTLYEMCKDILSFGIESKEKILHLGCGDKQTNLLFNMDKDQLIHRYNIYIHESQIRTFEK